MKEVINKPSKAQREARQKGHVGAASAGGGRQLQPGPVNGASALAAAWGRLLCSWLKKGDST